MFIDRAVHKNKNMSFTNATNTNTNLSTFSEKCSEYEILLQPLIIFSLLPFGSKFFIIFCN
jgi:hypothetical protein